MFTSVLIGVISTAIEERLSTLRKGNSLVLERDHIVILGHENGEFKLIEELIKYPVSPRLLEIRDFGSINSICGLRDIKDLQRG